MSKKNILSISINAEAATPFTSKESAVKFLMSKGIVRSAARILTNAATKGTPQTHVNATNTFKIEPAEQVSTLRVITDSAEFVKIVNAAVEAEDSKVASVPVSPYPFPMGKAPL